MTVKEHKLLRQKAGINDFGNLTEEMKRNERELTSGLKASFIRVKPSQNQSQTTKTEQANGQKEI